MLIAIALTVYFTFQSLQLEQRSLESLSRQSAMVLSSRAQYALASGNRNLLNIIIHNEKNRSGLAYAAVFDAQSPLKAELGPLPPDTGNWPASINDNARHVIDGVLYRASPVVLPDLPVSDDLRDFDRPENTGNRTLGTAVVGIDTQFISAQKNRLLAYAALLIIASVLLSSIMGWRLSKRLTGQVQLISHTVGRISRGEFSARLPAIPRRRESRPAPTPACHDAVHRRIEGAFHAAGDARPGGAYRILGRSHGNPV
jgi:methyl-accepting chemotaxis protein